MCVVCGIATAFEDLRVHKRPPDSASSPYRCLVPAFAQVADQFFIVPFPCVEIFSKSTFEGCNGCNEWRKLPKDLWTLFTSLAGVVAALHPHNVGLLVFRILRTGLVTRAGVVTQVNQIICGFPEMKVYCDSRWSNFAVSVLPSVLLSVWQQLVLPLLFYW